MSALEPQDFDPTSDEVLACPFPFYEAVRGASPAYELPGTAFLLTRYDDVLAAAKQANLFSNRRQPFSSGDPAYAAVVAEGYPEVATLSITDPPEHGRYRKLLSRAFSTRALRAMEPDMRVIADSLIDDFIAAGRVEVVSQLANLMPAYVIADALGVPRDAHVEFKRWSDDMVHLAFTPMARERHIECLRSVVAFQHYFAALIDERRADPGSDLVSHLVTSEIDGERPLDVPEILDLVRQFLVAGNETTASLIEGAMLTLLDHRDVLDALYADRSLIPAMLEEVVRLVSPAQWNHRTVTCDTNVSGVDIPAGAHARLVWASANRDPKYFPDPDRFDIHRDHSVQIAYGHGVHYCLGAGLARTEARVTFEAVLDRMKEIRLAVPRDEVRYLPHAVVRRLNWLPLQFETISGGR